MDHGLGDVAALLVVAHQPPPAHHPAERPLDDPAAWQGSETLLTDELAHDLEDEVVVGGLAHQLAAIVRPVGEQVPQPRPALTDGRDDPLRTRRVLHVGWGKADQQEPPIGVDGDVPLAALQLLRRIVPAALGRSGRLDGLAVQHARARACRTPGPLAVEQQRDVVDGAEQEAAHEAPEPPVNRLPRRKIVRQHPPAAAGTRQVADRVQDLAQVHARLAPPLGGRGQKRPDLLPLRVGQIGRIAPVLKSRLTCTVRLGPHPTYVGSACAISTRRSPFSNGHLDIFMCNQ